MTLTLPIRLDPASPPNETLHVTASGLPVRIYATDCGGAHPIHGAFFENGKWHPHSWWANGAYGAIDVATALDLRDRAPVKRGVWVAWFEGGSIDYARAYKTQAEAENAKHPIGTLRGVTYLADGDGLTTPAEDPDPATGGRVMTDHPTTYREAMRALNEAVYAAVRAANNEDGAPVEALRELAAEIDCLIDHNCTREELAVAWALSEGAKLAGTVR